MTSVPPNRRRLGRALARRSRDEGSAVVEFIVLGVGVLVPIVYLVVSVMSVQEAAFAGTQAVREAGRAFSTAASPREGRDRAEAAARLAFADHGLVVPAGALALACVGGPCLAPGSAVDVSLDWEVPLPWLPPGLTPDGTGGVPIHASHRVPIDDYRSSPEGGAP